MPQALHPLDESAAWRLRAWLSSWTQRPAAVLVAAILGLTVVRALVAASAGLTDDEAYYRLWALAPAMSYLDHPPMVAWMIAAGRWIAGDSLLGIRLPALLASLLGPFVLWRTTAILFGPRTAMRAVWLALAMPLLAVGGVIMTPDTPSVLFWGLAAWAVAGLHKSRNANWWLAVGLFAGLGLLSKYSNLFFGAGILLWLLLIPANRYWLRTWQLWAGGAISCLLTLPVVWWNAQHDWASFAKQFGRVGQGRQLAITYMAELAGGLVGLMSPVIAVLAGLGLWRLVRAAVSEKDQASALVASGMVPLLGYFVLHALHDRVQPNWLAPVYGSFGVCAAFALADVDRRSAHQHLFGTIGKWALAIGFLASGALYLHAIQPLPLTARLKDPTSQMRGWREFAAEVDRLRSANGACWIATSSYATTGQLVYQLKDKAPVVQLTERLRYAHLPVVADALLACPALYVELDRRSSVTLFGEHFHSVVPLGRVARQHGQTEVAAYTVYLADKPRAGVLRH